MRDLSSILQHAVAESIETLRSLGELDQQMRKAAELIENCFASGHKILVCGNGGSAADAAHFATEFVVRFKAERRGYPVICLSSDGGLLTAAGNDYGFDEVFARQVGALGLAGDVLICLTTSGNSANVQRALEEAKKRGLKTIAFLGRDGGTSKGIADIELLPRGESTARIQEAHKLLLHVLCQAMDERLPAQ
ncbi:MAG: SIS domain-containing protein [Verrucomicrobiota bacterium]